MITILLVASGFLLLASLWLSAMESAVFLVSESRVRTMREEGFRGADTLHRARSVVPGMRATLFYLNIYLNVAAVSVFAVAMVDRTGLVAALWAIPAGIVAIALFAEGLPRFVALRNPIRLALASAPLLLTVERWSRPLVFPMLQLEAMVSRRQNGNGDSDDAERELQELTELGRRQGVVEDDEHELVERAFRMDELTAWDIMTPRVDMFAWDESTTLAEIVPQLREVPYSRVPVYRGTVDEITGILYIREAYEAYVSGRGELPLSEISREPFFVPGSLPLPSLLRAFQTWRIHMGIVADEFGGTDGVVTLEDVIEELVGEIEDETDIREEPIRRLSKTEAEVEGGISLREVNYAMTVSLPHLEHRSLNGFILEELGRVPEAGEVMELPGMEIHILEASDTQVLRALLKKSQPVRTENVG